jgi:hypothetical protein
MSDMPEAITVFVSVAVTFLTFKSIFLLIDMLNRRARNSHLAGVKSHFLRP